LVTFANSWRRLRSSISHIRRNVKNEDVDGYLDAFMLKANIHKDEFPFLFMEIIEKIDSMNE